MADRLRQIALTVLGLVLVMAPLALWAAWNEAVFYAILAACAAAMALFVLLCRS